MQRGVWLLVLGVVASAVGVVGVAPARADGTGTTTTTSATTTGTTTTTPTPTYGPLASAYIPTTCIGAGDAAVATPTGRALVLGAPAAASGPSAYPTTSPLVAFSASAASGSTCTDAHVALTSVSLFGGFVTASTVSATNGRGTVSGLTIDGSPVTLSAGDSALLGYWGQLTLGKSVGRLRAPLVVLLLKRYWNLPAGTTIFVGFSAAALPVHTATTQRSPVAPQRTSTTPIAKPGNRSRPDHAAAKNPKHDASQIRAGTPPPAFPASRYPFLVDGSLGPAVQHNAVVSTAIQYLGIPYRWAGASPKTGFDCSGLVQYVFAQLGVSLVHNAAAQWYSPDGVSVPANKLQPGDLVFFVGSDGTRTEPGHVGIYVRDGYIIDAPHTGTFVRVDRLDEAPLANEYVGARRILGASLDNRHLLNTAGPGTSAGAVPQGGFPEFTIGRLAGDPLGLAAVQPAAFRTAQHGDWAWAGAGLGSLLRLSRDNWLWTGMVLGGLLLLLLAGGLVVLRRQSPDTVPSTDAPS
jgi:cell wall-associated NlpC family hydrolase